MMSTPRDERSDQPRSVTRRGALAMLAAAPLALAALPSIAHAAAVGADPVAAAVDELVAASRAGERLVERTGAVGAGAMVLVRAMVHQLERLKAEHGEDAGGAIWRAAMDRHYAWLGRRYGPGGGHA